MKIKDIYIEKKLDECGLVKAVVSKCPGAYTAYFKDLRDVKSCASLPSFFEKDTLILASQKGRFLNRCPCSPGQVSCGYYVVDWGMGCPYSCSYCYLNYYQNCHGMLVYANLEDCFREISEFLRKTAGPVRIGTGEFSDSLALEPVVPVAGRFIEYFSNQKKALLELKTKSANVDGLLNLSHNGRTVISWTVNTDLVAESDELNAPAVADRIDSAARVQNAGYPVAFHFDPVVFYRGWEKEYKDLVKKIFFRINPKSIAWTSLGTFRYNIQLKEMLYKYYSGTSLLEGEFAAGQDNKIKYFMPVRRDIYKKMVGYLAEHIPLSKVYLCMESPQMWSDMKEFARVKYRQKLGRKIKKGVASG